MRVGNLLRAIGPSAADEQLDTLLQAPGVRIERIVSHGHASPPGFWYDQACDEWVLMVAGSARLRLEGEAETLALLPGDFVHLPAGTRHRVEWTDASQPTIWLAVHLEPPRDEQRGGVSSPAS